MFTDGRRTPRDRISSWNELKIVYTEKLKLRIAFAFLDIRAMHLTLRPKKSVPVNGISNLS